MRILIIGATGFIGTHLASDAAAQGIEVVTLSRNGACPTAPNQIAFVWSFGQRIPEAACMGVACAVHLAHDFDGEDGARRTVNSTIAIATQLQAAGVRRQLFFSSYSAGEHASSLYGRTKSLIERQLMAKPGMVIVRPGLVLGEGGIYGRIRKWAQILPFVPLPEGGRGEVPVIAIKKLCRLAIELMEDSAPPAEVNLFEHELKSLRQLVLEAAAEVGRQPWILPVPGFLLIAFLKLAQWLYIPLPVNADNLAGYLSNQAAQHVSTLEE